MKVIQHKTATRLRQQTNLPWCFIDELLRNGLRPDTSWAGALPAWQETRQTLNVLEPLGVTNLMLKPYVCYHTTVIFYNRNAWSIGRVVEEARCDLEARTYPRISFVERRGELWEVGPGSVIPGRRQWWFVYRCWRNTEWARHFRGACEDGCRPCRQVTALAPYAR